MTTTHPNPIPTSLTESTRTLRAQLRAQLGTVADQFDEAADQLAKSDIGTAAPKTGSSAPDFTLPDVRGDAVTLSELTKRGSVVLVFYRGAWCPYCNLQLNAFKSAMDDLRNAGASLVAVSPQTPDHSLSFAEKSELPFTVLSDVGNRVARDYGLVFRQDDQPTRLMKELGIDLAQFNGDESHELPAAATFVIGTGRRVRFASVARDYRWRVGPAEVIAALTRQQ